MPESKIIFELNVICGLALEMTGWVRLVRSPAVGEGTGLAGYWWERVWGWTMNRGPLCSGLLCRALHRGPYLVFMQPCKLAKIPILELRKLVLRKVQ